MRRWRRFAIIDKAAGNNQVEEQLGSALISIVYFLSFFLPFPTAYTLFRHTTIHSTLSPMADPSKPDEPKPTPQRKSIARDALDKLGEKTRQNTREFVEQLGTVEPEPKLPEAKAKDKDQSEGGTRWPRQYPTPTRQEMADAELRRFMPEQVRAEYQKADADQRTVIWEANKRAFAAAKKRKEESRLREEKLMEKVFDLLQRTKEDSSNHHLLPPVDASTSDLKKWYEEMQKPVRPVPFPTDADEQVVPTRWVQLGNPERDRQRREEDLLRERQRLVEREEQLQQSASARRILDATREQRPAESAASGQSSPPPAPIFRKRVHSWFQRYAGWAFVGASIGMASIAEYAVAIVLLVVAFVPFAIQIHEWSGHIQRRWLLGIVKGIWCVGVIGMLLFFGVAFYKMKASKPWSNLLAGSEAPPAANHTPTPAAQVSEPIADTPKPNIIPVSFGERHLRFDPSTKTFMTADTGIRALVAEFRNAHERGKEIIEGKDIRAHIYFEPFDFYKKLDKNIPGFAHVEEGIWLNEKSAVVNFARGEAKTLVLVVELEPNGVGGFDAFDHSISKRPDGTEVLLPRVPKITANKYVVKVEITGGAKGEIAELYHFTITLRPKLTISFG